MFVQMKGYNVSVSGDSNTQIGKAFPDVGQMKS